MALFGVSRVNCSGSNLPVQISDLGTDRAIAHREFLDFTDHLEADGSTMATSLIASSCCMVAQLRFNAAPVVAGARSLRGRARLRRD
jgi:hypothetical protein